MRGRGFDLVPDDEEKSLVCGSSLVVSLRSLIGVLSVSVMPLVFALFLRFPRLPSLGFRELNGNEFNEILKTLHRAK